MLGTLDKDLRFALRMLAKGRGVTVVAVLSLALGVGGVTAIFSLIDAVMLRRLPVTEPQRLVVFGLAPGPNDSRFSYPLYRQSRDRCQALSELIAFTPDTRLVVREVTPAGSAPPAARGGEPQVASGQLVSGNFFSGLGVRAAVGRVLSREDERQPGAHPVAVLSYRYWQRRFASDPAVVGRAVNLNGTVFTIVGVAQRGFFGVLVGRVPDYFLPVMMQADIRYRGNASTNAEVDFDKPWVSQAHISWLGLLGRLAPGVPPEKAGAEMGVLFHQASAALLSGDKDSDSRDEARKTRITVASGERGVSRLRGQFVEPLFILLGAAALVLLVACANVANLLLARAEGRRKEVAVRLSLGSSRGLLVRQLLLESLLLAGTGAACGLLLAVWGRRLLLGLASISSESLALDAGLNLRMLVFAAFLSVATAVLFGLAPALQTTRVDLVSSLKEGGRALHGGGASGRSRLPLGRLLVVAQVSLSLALLIGAGLFLRSLGNLQRLDTGFRRGHLLLVSINPELLGLTDLQKAGLYHRLLERVTALPGVRSASISLFGLVGGSRRTSTVDVKGYSARPGEDREVQEMTVTPDYFATVGMSLASGRGFLPSDDEKAARVGVINEAMERHFFAGRSAVGGRFGFDGRADAIEVVGVVRDAKVNNLKDSAAPWMAFRPLPQAMDDMHDIEVRSDLAPAALVAPLRAAIREVAPDLSVSRISTIEEQIGESLSNEQAVARLTGAFGVLALLLAAIGLYGVISYGVARRTNEIGLRMALGAHRGTVLGLIFRETLLLTVAGILVGLPCALLAAPLAKSQLFGLTAGDPPTLSIATLVMLGVAACAGFLPAQRATEVDPMIALRAD